MRKRPGERYQGAASLCTDLTVVLEELKGGVPTARYSRTPVPAKRPKPGARRFFR